METSSNTDSDADFVSSSEKLIEQESDNLLNEGYEATETFAEYKCEIVKEATKAKTFEHPDPVLETAAFASICGPQGRFALMLPPNMYTEKRLSSLQAETISLVCQRHEIIMMNGERAGFFIGDGAGVGKGRTIAGIISENIMRKRFCSVWFSINNELMASAKRDFNDLGMTNMELKSLSKISIEKRISLEFEENECCCLFATYHTLIQESRNGNMTTRLDQIMEWLTENFCGVVVFDECHKTKHLMKHKGHEPSKIAIAVQNFQRRLKKARIVYASATGACNPSEMGYMTRLGLWGLGTPFEKFEDFLSSVNKCGVVGMESLAMDMKYRGVYIARHLSFAGATFAINVCTVTQEQLEIYNFSTEAWALAYHLFTRAATIVNMSKKEKVTMNISFWATHQRYFKTLCLSIKVPTVVQIAKDAIGNGQSVVLALQTTGEANLNEYMDSESSKEPMLKGVSLCEGIFHTLISKHFPKSESAEKKEILDDYRAIILKAMKKINFPENPLDALINTLGGSDYVAEMTGRKFLVVFNKLTGVYKIKRRQASGKLEGLNLKERDDFMNRNKRIAIISDTASCGISLHSDKTKANQDRRVHITLELPWAADKAIQQFGRTLRSNQLASLHTVRV